MKKKKNIIGKDPKEWAEIAARLSGERNGSASQENLSEMEKELQKQWNDIKMTYREREIDVDKAWAKVSNRIAAEEDNKKIVLRPRVPLFMKIAASALIIIGLGWAGWRIVTPANVVVATAANEKNVTVTLPDGSKVWLNRSTTLTYPSKFTGNRRDVKLTGEAFFDVERDESKPFTIDAGNASIRVLGTSFSVLSDNGNNEVEVLVESGSVMVTSSNGNNSVTLKPGYIGRVSDQTEANQLNYNNNYMSWNTDKLVYNGEELITVFEDLKHAYGIEITTDDPEINRLTITSVFEELPHDTIIKVICTTFNLKYEKNGEQYMLIKK